MKILKWFFLGPVLLLIVIFSGCELNKAYWDYQVTKMCKKDGGVTVYEKVELSQDEYKKYGGVNGVIPVRSEKYSRADKFDYLAKTEYILMRESNPKLSKSHSWIYRKKDKKVMGEFVSYGRSGGDFPTIIQHPSSFSCADVVGIELDIEKQIFNIKGEM
jgi:hypothetical protein